jgi:energy-coupling factor transporter transmembrane protein EcfT
MSIVFAATTSLPDLTDAVERMLHPLGRNMRAISAMIMLTLQYVPLFIRNARAIKMAQISRGADLDSRWSSQVRFALSAALPLFVSAFRTSSQLSLAMEARGFDPGIRRSAYSQLHPGARDAAAVLISLLLASLTVAAAF